MLCAAAVALVHQVPLDRIAATLEQPIRVPGRMESVRAGQPFSVVVDYAHTPESIEKVLRLLRDLNPTGRLIIVTGSAGERDREKRPLQGAVAARLADFAMFTTEDPRFEDADAIIDEIAAGAVEAGAVRGRGFDCVTDRTDAIARALALAGPGDTVLLAGKGHERSIIWGKEKRPWDEAGVATEVLQSMGFAGSA
jgi:UDP-N-acetylmuramoyl-L-alanyl-D-glutamate--2,6-diaminopimelate ligase